MIKKVLIKNYALIDQLEVDLSDGMSVLTGETGAGKSILVGALSLVTGSRAESSVVRDSTKKCVVEADFQIDKYNLDNFFDKNNLDYESTTILRREILPSGKSRAFINDTPVSIAQLRKLGLELLDVHSQHQKLLLYTTRFQFLILDAYADNKKCLTEYSKTYSSYISISKDLEKLIEAEKTAKTDQDYWQFQFDELNAIGLNGVDFLQLEDEAKLLANAEEIKLDLGTLLNILDRSETPITQQFAECNVLLSKLSSLYGHVKPLNSRFEEVYIELKDLVGELESLADSVDVDPDRMTLIQDRLDSFYKLQKKHNLNSLQDLINLKNELGAKLQETFSLSSGIKQLRKEKGNLEVQLMDVAELLSQKRKNAIGILEKEVSRLLSHMGMPSALLKIQLETFNELDSNGINGIDFLFKANKGSEFCPLSKCASGGELSRLMLALKAGLPKRMSMPTIVFDEIDTGISGEVADKVGDIVYAMSKEMQVLIITHLPQIACKGQSHYLAYKESDNETTRSSLRMLDQDERIVEIAKMLSGEELSMAAVNNAKDLLSIK